MLILVPSAHSELKGGKVNVMTEFKAAKALSPSGEQAHRGGPPTADGIYGDAVAGQTIRDFYGEGETLYVRLSNGLVLAFPAGILSRHIETRFPGDPGTPRLADLNEPEAGGYS
jgi:hypothetical protein